MEANEALHLLTKAGVPSPDADWRWISQANLSAEARAEAVTRRCNREPLQLILGSAGFRYLDIQVRPGVFIPRPETEWLVQLCLDHQMIPDGARVIEPCTGTGAISASIAHETAASAIIATDINPEAVDLAKTNCAPYPQVDVREGDLLGPLPAEWAGLVDLLVSNPPYLDAATVAEAEPEVKDWDPYNALVGPGPDGWDIVRDLIDQAPAWLAPGGWLALEDDPARVHRSADRARPWASHVDVVNDLAGRERFVIAQLG